MNSTSAQRARASRSTASTLPNLVQGRGASQAGQVGRFRLVASEG